MPYESLLDKHVCAQEMRSVHENILLLQRDSLIISWQNISDLENYLNTHKNGYRKSLSFFSFLCCFLFVANQTES